VQPISAKAGSSSASASYARFASERSGDADFSWAEPWHP